MYLNMHCKNSVIFHYNFSIYVFYCFDDNYFETVSENREQEIENITE